MTSGSAILWGLVALVVLVIVPMIVHVYREYERGVLFRLGRLVRTAEGKPRVGLKVRLEGFSCRQQNNA